MSPQRDHDTDSNLHKSKKNMFKIEFYKRKKNWFHGTVTNKVFPLQVERNVNKFIVTRRKESNMSMCNLDMLRPKV